MTMGAKTEVLTEALGEYLRASKECKKAILDRLESVVRMHRKAIIRRLKMLQLRAEGINWHEGRGRPVVYGKDVTAALRDVWEIGNEMCSERLHEEVNEYVDILVRDHMWKHNEEVTEKLRCMSIGTMKERLSHFDRVVSGGGRSMTKPSSLKEIIPVRRGPWQNPDPGVGEIDTVAHCGCTAEGRFGYTVQYTDICLTWNFLEGQVGKDKQETLASMKRMQARSPFRICGLDPDTGSEFINWHCKEWCDREGIDLTRIRPGMKNDHGHIEQKNDMNVRKFAGYIRIDTPEKLMQLKKLLAIAEIYITVNSETPQSQIIATIEKAPEREPRQYDTNTID